MLEAVVRQFLYYPVKLPRDAPVPEYAASAEEIWMDADDGNHIHGLRWPTPAGRPTIVFFHGNAQSVYEWALIQHELRPLECGLLLIDYPGYGKSSGSPSEAGLYSSGRAALSQLVEEGVDESSIVVFGKSLGGPVATEVAKGRSVRGVILESTFRSIPDVSRKLLPMLPMGAMLNSELFESAARMKEITAPVLVVHGTFDELIPVSEGKALHEMANKPKELYLVENAGHNDVSFTAGKAYTDRLRAWLDDL